MYFGVDRMIHFGMSATEAHFGPPQEMVITHHPQTINNQVKITGQYAFDTTEAPTVSHHVTSATCAINAKKPSQAATFIQGTLVQMSRQQDLFHKGGGNPLPNQIVSYVNIPAIRSLASGYPKMDICKYILDGLQFGFKLGFIGEVKETRPKNLVSANKNNEKVTKAVIKELERGHTSGPFLNPPVHQLHCSPIGAVMKKDGSCRLVMDLSQPKGCSINEGILKEEFSVLYSKFDDAIKLV